MVTPTSPAAEASSNPMSQEGLTLSSLLPRRCVGILAVVLHHLESKKSYGVGRMKARHWSLNIVPSSESNFGLHKALVTSGDSPQATTLCCRSEQRWPSAVGPLRMHSRWFLILGPSEYNLAGWHESWRKCAWRTVTERSWSWFGVQILWPLCLFLHFVRLTASALWVSVMDSRCPCLALPWFRCWPRPFAPTRANILCLSFTYPFIAPFSWQE